MYVKDRLRRSMMFVPGNNPGMIRDAHIYGADSIMFDLEDSVAYTEKDSARFLVYNALKTLHFGSKETVVRINDLSSGLGIKDLEAVVRAGVQVVRLPSCRSPSRCTIMPPPVSIFPSRAIYCPYSIGWLKGSVNRVETSMAKFVLPVRRLVSP